MGLVSLHSLFAPAHRGGYALGYFEAWDSYSLEAVLEAAQAERSPVILGFGCMMLDGAWLDAGGIETLGRIGRVTAERATVPTALLLNETHTYEQALRGMDAGFNAVMMDSSSWPWDESVERTSELVRAAHARGVAVEAELGRLPDAVNRSNDSIDDTAASLTDPEQAALFVEQTNVDCLAVSIGNVHLLTDAHAPVDLQRLGLIHAHVHVPLVIHGGTSFPPSGVPQAIAHGVLKFNVGTGLKRAFFEGLRATLNALPGNADVHAVIGSHKPSDLMHAGKARMTDKVREWMRMFGSSGKA